ncbi:MAG: hypothetical protein AAFY72_05815 [Cyanobacteria bacterium J06649_4]
MIGDNQTDWQADWFRRFYLETIVADSTQSLNLICTEVNPYIAVR